MVRNRSFLSGRRKRGRFHLPEQDGVFIALLLYSTGRYRLFKANGGSIRNIIFLYKKRLNPETSHKFFYYLKTIPIKKANFNSFIDELFNRRNITKISVKNRFF